MKKRTQEELNDKLYNACKEGVMSKIMHFVEIGADVNYINKYDTLHLTVILYYKSHYSGVKYMIEKGADLIYTTSRTAVLDHLYAKVSGNVKTLHTWLETYETQKLIIDRNPKVYFVLKKLNKLNNKIEEEYSHICAGGDLNLL